ncbi:hypothetical protein FNV43_RR23814 [Rhamnella rubrinervis]|uniref:Uncharacterized protein n=1 Tax=Rhamnella rubrinervis TaxID=2594499 RepID=A0A8K0DWX8_9ROSA|nr:hypothetical protein FNV43_RR23814 [Rhamnella rubrinervis]
MGGCASKPKEADLVGGKQPAPTEAPAPAEQPAAETVAQENNDGGESKKEEPLVEPVETKEEVVVESKAVDAAEPVVSADAAVVDETAKPAEGDKVEEKVETPKEKVEAVKEVQGPAKEQVVEASSDKPLVAEH